MVRKGGGVAKRDKAADADPLLVVSADSFGTLRWDHQEPKMSTAGWSKVTAGLTDSQKTHVRRECL